MGSNSRVFGSRTIDKIFSVIIDVELLTPDQDSDAVSGIRQGSVKKVFNNKIHPGNTESHAKSAVNVEEFKQRQAELQKNICILLCTTFPLLTTAATLVRLWQVGIIDFISKQGFMQ